MRKEEEKERSNRRKWEPGFWSKYFPGSEAYNGAILLLCKGGSPAAALRHEGAQLKPGCLPWSAHGGHWNNATSGAFMKPTQAHRLQWNCSSNFCSNTGRTLLSDIGSGGPVWNWRVGLHGPHGSHPTQDIRWAARVQILAHKGLQLGRTPAYLPVLLNQGTFSLQGLCVLVLAILVSSSKIISSGENTILFIPAVFLVTVTISWQCVYILGQNQITCWKLLFPLQFFQHYSRVSNIKTIIWKRHNRSYIKLCADLPSNRMP